ncbi:hypothetical protein BN159_1486 [Streptomyces davaonensis JCM 4913]|uniref:Uncharacterized protein n=1 Tax=Streptomyces davaonensis (strain DSM 101723 / JCM 4913 / KCC S-0913 / 768) TaxID=1214101 RepID=K4QYG8_STRDJ|nr:hypothetical protein BN159_1486 [Streptomyces davaonensis JCM 4913]
MTPAVHHLLSDDGVRKRLGEDFDPEQAEEVLDGLIARIGEETASDSTLPQPTA